METGRLVDRSPGGRSPAPALTPFTGLRWAWLLWPAAAGAAWFAVRSLPLEAAWKAITGLQAWQVAVLAAANLAVLALFAGRWGFILGSFGSKAPFTALLGYRLAGFGLSYFTPGPQVGGEPLQVLLLHRRQGVPAATAVASVFFEKLLEMLSNFTFLVIGLLVVASSGLAGGNIPFFAWPLAGSVLALPVMHLAALRRGRRPLAGLIGRAAGRFGGRFWQAGARHAREAEDLIGAFCRERPADLARAIGISALVWAASLAEFHLLLRFLGVAAGPVQTVGILTAARVAFLLPLPAGLGALEASQYLAMQAAGFDPLLGLAASLIIRARDVMLGLIGLLIGGWGLRRF